MITTANKFDALLNRFGHDLTDELLETAERVEIYLVARSRGSTHRGAEMYALRKPPGERTSDQWWAHNRHFSQIMGEQYAEEVRTLLARRGVQMGPWDDYDPGMAKFKGDPDAVISGHAGPRERIMRAQRLLADHYRRQDEAPPVRMAESLIKRKMRAIEKEHPEVKRAPARERAAIREKIIETHSMSLD